MKKKTPRKRSIPKKKAAKAQPPRIIMPGEDRRRLVSLLLGKNLQKVRP